MATETDRLLNRNFRTPHILNMQRGKAGEINQLWIELAQAMLHEEGRPCMPEIERISVSTLSVGNLGNVNDGILVEGRGFIPVGWYRAMVNIDTGVANSGIDWWATQPGLDGNNLRVVYAKGGGALAVAYNPATRTLTVTLAVGGSNANAVIAAVAADLPSYSMFNPVNEFGSGGGGVINSNVASTALTGGAGTALRNAELTVTPGGGNDQVRYIARMPGTPGNAISVEYTVGLGAGVAPVVTVVSQAISVQIRAAVTLANDVIAAVNAEPEARRLVKAMRVYNDTGAGAIGGAVAAANLTNGADGVGVRAVCGGLTFVAATSRVTICAVTDTTFFATFDALAESAAAETAYVEFDICGRSFRIPMTLVA